MRIPRTMLNWYKATSRPLCFGVEISVIYAGAATVEAPTPNPPIKRKAAKVQGSLDMADPSAEAVYKIPIQINVFFRPSLFVGMPAKAAPITVPQSAPETTTQP